MDNDQTMTLVIIRHGESEWNLKNHFTGWTDVDLTDTGRAEAHAGGKALKEAGYDFDLCYTSLLKRAILTLNCVLDELDRNWLPVTKAWQLNERHYGALQGLNKADAAAEHGDTHALELAHDELADMVESRAETGHMDFHGQEFDIQLFAAPVLAWSRFSIPASPLPKSTVDALAVHLGEA